MIDTKYLIFLIFLAFLNLDASEFVQNLKDAKVGECYQKIFIPAKYETKEELVEVEKNSTKLKVTEPEFKHIKKTIMIEPKYIDIKDNIARFKTVDRKLPTSEQKIYFSLENSSKVPLSQEFINYVKSKGANLDALKVGECFSEYLKTSKIKIQKQYTKKEAYEIIDVEPAKFKTIKKKIQLKPAYTKIIKTPAVYETKAQKVLISPERKEFITKKNNKVCVVLKPAEYKTIIKKVMISPPTTKMIKFPPTFKEVEVKVLVSPPKVTRRLIPELKEDYDFFVDANNTYIWSKRPISGAKKTGLKICKRLKKPTFTIKKVQAVQVPATTKKTEVPAKTIMIDTKKLVKKAKVEKVKLPAQYQKLKTKLLISPQKIVWKKINCN